MRCWLQAVLGVFWLAMVGSADDWPQWRGPTRDGRWHETGVLERLPSPRLPIAWSAPVSPGYTSPTVAKGRVYLSDRVTEPEEQERILCFDANSGKLLWRHVYACAYTGISYKAGPRAAVTIHDGRAYALGSMGHLHCLAADTGAVLWQKDLNAEYAIQMPTWALSAAPVVESDLLILHIGGAANAAVVALDRVTGKERWRALPDKATYSTPTVIDQAGKRVVVCWTAARVAGLDALTGKLLWESALPTPKRLIGVPDPVVDGQQLLVSDFWMGTLMLRLATKRTAVSQVWARRGASEKQTDALHAMITTPILAGTHIYGVDSYGELRCLEAATGDRVWESLELLPKIRWGTIHMVRNQDKTWMLTEKGELAITRLSPQGVEIISRSKLIEPSKQQHPRGVIWSHPAFANRRIFIRNDHELVCADLAAPGE